MIKLQYENLENQSSKWKEDIKKQTGIKIL